MASQPLLYVLLALAVLSTVPIIVRETKKSRQDRLDEITDGDCYPASLLGRR